jgi:hypothetical protein
VRVAGDSEWIGQGGVSSDNQERTAVVVTNRVVSKMIIAVVIGCVSLVAPAEAQLNTQHIKGTIGLKSGSQAPPGVYFIAPLFYVYKTDEVKDRDEVRLPFTAHLTSQMYGGGISVVTKGKLFGGFYGMWGQEFSVGTTVYLSESREWHAATLAPEPRRSAVR